MPDINKEASEFWNALKPMIDEEIKAQTRGMVQRRKMKVTTAPSLVSGVIGVTEPFGTEILIPFNTNLISASVGDVVWVEYMYGMSNAFASMFASADEKDMTVAGGLSVIGNAGIGGNLGINGNTTLNGILDITPRRCYATLSSAGWYRVLEGSTTIQATATGAQGQYIEFNIQKASSSENHSIELRFNSASGIGFVNERSKSHTQHIDKIRYTYNTTTYNWYVDIHFTDTSAHNVGVDFVVHTASATFRSSIASAGLVSVAASPRGETIVTEYTFNANGTGDLNVNGTVTGQGFADLLFGYGNGIASNTNCDALLTEGKYTCPSAAVGGTLTNPPYTSAFGMFVFRVAESQRLVQMASPNSTSCGIKARYWNGSSWTDWKTVRPGLTYVDDSTAANYTIGSGNYVAVNYPSGLNGSNVVNISLLVWTSNSGPFTIMPYGSTGASWYIIGAAGTTINGARFRYWYID